MSDAETRIDWSSKVDDILRRYVDTLRQGDTIEGLDYWLQQVPQGHRDSLREMLEQARDEVSQASVETRIVSSDAILGIVADRSNTFSLDEMPSASAVSECQTFMGLSGEASTALQSQLQESSFATGETLLKQGETGRGLHLLLSGSVDIVDVQTGERIDVDGAGSVLGEMSLLTGQPCSADVVATSDVKALSLSADAYHAMKAEHPEMEIALSQLVSDRLGGRKHDALCGKTIGDYQLVRCINRGGMGVVYEARHIRSGLAVALKMLRHRFIYDDMMQSRFDQEAVLLEGLRHENIVSFQEHFLAFRTRFLVLDLCDGPDLFRLSRVRGPFDEPTTRAILGQIAMGLRYAHQSGVVHRDLKPGNVLVDLNGRARLTDFGLSKLLASEVPSGKAVGTPAYMPPEQFRTENVGPECDWYALGCLACEMLTGRILFRGSSWREMYDEKALKVPTTQWPPIDASDELRGVICDALEPSLEKRTIDLDLIASWADEAPLRDAQNPLRDAQNPLPDAQKPVQK